MKFLILTYISVCIICSSAPAQTSRSTYKISSNKDSIVLNDPPPFHNGVQIYRDKKKILDYTNPDIQINSLNNDGNDSNWFTEYRGNEHFYVIRVFTGPQPDQFLILEITDLNAVVFGTTEQNSAEIFGDIDYDGKFEIGGMTLFCQGGDPNCHPEDHYRVFEIAPNFPTDTGLTNFFKQFLKKK